MAHPQSTFTKHAEPRVFEPVKQPHKSTIIFLHGRGDTGHNIAPFLLFSPITNRVPTNLRLNHMLPHTKFVFPTALKRNVRNSGAIMTQWFDIDHLQVTDMGEEGQVEGVKESSDYVYQLAQNEIAKGISPEKIVLMGLSQGAATGAIATLRYPGRLGGFVGLSGWLPFITQFEGILAEGNGLEAVVQRLQKVLDGKEEIKKEHIDEMISTPIFIGHGIHDGKILPKSGSRLKDAFQKAGFKDVCWAVYEEGHWWCDEEIVDVVRWLAKRGFETQGLEELKGDTTGARIASSSDLPEGYNVH